MTIALAADSPVRGASGGPTTDHDLAEWMTRVVHARGRISRPELQQLAYEAFGETATITPRTLQMFRKAHRGQVSFVAAGQYWRSLRPTSTAA